MRWFGRRDRDYREELDPPDLWLPLTTQAVISRRSFLNTRNASWLGILGRLRPGLSVCSATPLPNRRYTRN
jgi:hypothetical protein